MSRGALSRIMASPKCPNPNTGMLFYAGRGIRVAHRLTVDLEMGTLSWIIHINAI